MKDRYVVVVNNNKAGARFFNDMDAAKFWRDKVRRNGYVAEIVSENEFNLLFENKNYIGSSGKTCTHPYKMVELSSNEKIKGSSKSKQKRIERSVSETEWIGIAPVRKGMEKKRNETELTSEEGILK